MSPRTKRRCATTTARRLSSGTSSCSSSSTNLPRTASSTSSTAPAESRSAGGGTHRVGGRGGSLIDRQGRVDPQDRGVELQVRELRGQELGPDEVSRPVVEPLLQHGLGGDERDEADAGDAVRELVAVAMLQR